jgi:hypothetical protein
MHVHLLTYGARILWLVRENAFVNRGTKDRHRPRKTHDDSLPGFFFLLLSHGIRVIQYLSSMHVSILAWSWTTCTSCKNPHVRAISVCICRVCTCACVRMCMYARVCIGECQDADHLRVSVSVSVRMRTTYIGQLSPACAIYRIR